MWGEFPGLRGEPFSAFLGWMGRASLGNSDQGWPTMQSFLTFERVGSAEVQRGVRGAGAPRGRSVGGSLFERWTDPFLTGEE